MKRFALGLIIILQTIVIPAALADLEPHERQITILGTNDIHGGVESKPNNPGARIGGMALWAGAAHAIREGLAQRWGNRAGTLVVDAGDQFQGTLISNFSEGQLMFAAMNAVGYDAVVPGNHDYDFGPIGWLEDQVSPTSADQNPRGALQRLVSQAKFPLLSANTYLKNTLVSRDGVPAQADHVSCKSSVEVDWNRAKRPEFLIPYLIREAAGVRVALIGIDNEATSLSTALSNVEDLCFRDEVETYLDIQRQLVGKADVFVLVIHNGDIATDHHASKLVERVLNRGGHVDAVIAGHTHAKNESLIQGVPLIQSRSGGMFFGRVDLIWDTKTKSIIKNKTRSTAAIRLLHEACAEEAKSFCSVSQKKLRYEGVEVVESSEVLGVVAKYRREIDPLADRKLGVALDRIEVDRTDESPLANAMTDSLREISRADVSFLNTGGLRAPIEPGEITYEDLYRVVPFNNHTLVIGPMPVEGLVEVLKRSIKSCGAFGALMQSGLRVVFDRDCRGLEGQIDENARLVRVETADGELLFDESSQVALPAGRTLLVATLDFLSAGGSGYAGFKDLPKLEDLGILRERLTEHYLKNPLRLRKQVDGRWKNRKAGS